MAFYDINTNLPGVKKVLRSESAAIPSSSTLIPVFFVALDPVYMQDTTDGYEACQSNTNTSDVVILAPEAVNANEWAGQWVWVGSGQFSTPEVRQIVEHPAAAANASLALTVDVPFSVAPTSGDQANVRRWEDFNVPSPLLGGLNDFTKLYIGTDSSGALTWTNCENAFYTIKEHKNNGGPAFYVVPVPFTSGDDADDLAERFAAVVDDATFQLKMNNLVVQPHLLCIPKQPSLPASLSAAQWATVDVALIAYATSRATDETVDSRLRELFCVLDTPSSAVAASVTYRNSTLNATSARAEMVFAQYLTGSITPGSLQVVCGSPARCGVINRVSVSAPESWGHAMEGANFTQVAALKLVNVLSETDQLTLSAAAINPLVSAPGEGFWFLVSSTQAKSSTDVGADPLEYSHIVIGRAQIWNTLQRILATAVSEPNNAVVRQALLARVDSVMAQLQGKGLIASYVLSDVTSDADVAGATARFELSVSFNGVMRFIELTLVSSVGQ